MRGKSERLNVHLVPTWNTEWACVLWSLLVVTCPCVAFPVVSLPFGPWAVHLRADAKPLSCCCSPSREQHRPAEGCQPVTALSGALLCCISIKKKKKIRKTLNTAAPKLTGQQGLCWPRASTLRAVPNLRMNAFEISIFYAPNCIRRVSYY